MSETESDLVGTGILPVPTIDYTCPADLSPEPVRERHRNQSRIPAHAIDPQGPLDSAILMKQIASRQVLQAGVIQMRFLTGAGCSIPLQPASKTSRRARSNSVI